jgi:hypothetical protein
MKCFNGCDVEMEKIAENEYYCQKCDKSFAVRNGKVKNESKGRIQVIEENLAITQRILSETRKELLGKEDDGLFGIEEE